MLLSPSFSPNSDIPIVFLYMTSFFVMKTYYRQQHYQKKIGSIIYFILVMCAHHPWRCAYYWYGTVLPRVKAWISQHHLRLLLTPYPWILLSIILAKYTFLFTLTFRSKVFKEPATLALVELNAY